MTLDTFILIASQYMDEEDALADFETVRSLYQDLGVIDTYDGAVITKSPPGANQRRFVASSWVPCPHQERLD